MPTTTESFLAALVIIFALPWLAWRLGRLDPVAPLVVVQIVGGILLGPGVLGAAAPAVHAQIFTPSVIAALNGIAWWAVMLFVFIAGVELDLAAAWAQRRDTAVTATLAFAAPLLTGAGAASLLLLGPGWAGAAAAPWQVVTGIGMASAVTALPILVLFLERLDLLGAPLGQRILRYASLDDIVIWGVLAVILLDWNRVGLQLGFLAAVAVAAAAMRQLMPRLDAADRWPVALVWVAGCGLGADWAGLHYMVGAFVAGAVLDRDWFGDAAITGFRRHILLAMMPVFFLSTGLRTSFGIGGTTVFAGAALLLAAAVAGKLAGVHLAGRLLGWRPGEAAIIGWLLQTKALVMIIFANILLDHAIISSDAFTALLLMAVGSTMLTIPIVTPRLARWHAASAGPATRDELATEAPPATAPH